MLEWNDAFAACPLVAILRGITPLEVVAAVDTLIEAGFQLIEIPLNSPEALVSIRKASQASGERALLGAGTVLRAEQVRSVREAGGRLVVAPNFDRKVAAACSEESMFYGPGVCTPTEAFAAIEAGATFLKLFPAEMISPSVIRAMRAVLPRSLQVLPVGGITPDNMGAYLRAGADGVGIGSALYSPGIDITELNRRARMFIARLEAERNNTA